MPRSPRFLIIDSEKDSCALLTWSLKRMYPAFGHRECASLEEARKILAEWLPDVVIVHKAADEIGVNVVRELRVGRPHLPILMFSSADHQKAAMAAGATRFLQIDEWLKLRQILDTILDVDGALEPS